MDEISLIMTKKKTRKDYEYYTVSIPNSLRILFKAYIDKYPQLGFKNVSSFVHHILKEEGRKIISENPDLERIEEITLSSGTYILKEDGTYGKVD